MQIRVGKKRSSRGLEWSERSAIACFYPGIILLLLFFSGCSSLQKNKNLEKSYQSLCFTSQGKGRLEYGRSRHLFNYEALWKDDEQSWSLALDLPVIGQELITFLPTEGGSKTSVKGTFSNRLKAEVTSPKQKKLLQVFYLKAGELLSVIKGKANPNVKERWEIGLDESVLLAKSKIGKKSSFTLKAFDLDKHYQRMTLSYNVLASGQEKSVMKLQLFVYECSL